MTITKSELMRIPIAAATAVWTLLLPLDLRGAEPPQPPKRPQNRPLAAPADWKSERIALPPPFAPDMKLRGAEEVRFAPGMFDPASDSFFSYVFVFQIEAQPEWRRDVIERELLAYYRGLAKAVLKGSPVDVDTAAFTLRVTELRPDPPQADPGPAQFEGELKWVEPFATRKPQQLRLEIHAWTDRPARRSYLFVCVSPQAAEAAIWKTMREVRSEFLKAE